MKTKLWKIFVLLIVSTLWISACGTAATPTAAPAEPVQLVVARAMDLTTLDPHRAFEDTALIVLKGMYDQLTGLDPNDPSVLIPSLAESWSISDDGKVYTFKIRSGVKFSSGNDLTVEDVKFSLERLQNLKGNPSFLLDGVVSVDIIDSNTITITLANPDASFLSKTAAVYMCVIDSKVAIANGAISGPDADTTDTAQTWFDSNSAGSGPFVFESWTRDADIRFQANPNYWAGKPNVDSIVIKEISDTTSQRLLLAAGDIDIAMNIDPDAAKEMEGTAGVVVTQGRSFNQVYMGMTGEPANSEILANNQMVRQAISFAIDYDGLNNQVLAGNAEQPPSIVPLGFLSADAVQPIKRDLAKARQLLADAGFADGVELDLYYPNSVYYGVDFGVVAQKLQSDLAEVGITLTTIPQEQSVFMPAYRATELPMIISYWAPDWLDPSALIDTFATPTSLVSKRLGYINEENGTLSAQALATTDRQKRIDLYAQIQQNLQNDANILGLIQPKVVLAYRDNISNYFYHPIATLDLYAVVKK